MKEFIEKLIGRLEEVKEIEKNRADSCDEEGYGDGEQIYDDGRSQGRFEQSHKIIQIVNELAEEYINTSTDTSSGWISVLERLPELTEGTEFFRQSKCCLVALKWWDGDITESIGWYNQSGTWNDDSKNCKVIAWMPLPEPYIEQQKELSTTWQQQTMNRFERVE